jgi:hypothetical protein
MRGNVLAQVHCKDGYYCSDMEGFTCQRNDSLPAGPTAPEPSTRVSAEDAGTDAKDANEADGD